MTNLRSLLFWMHLATGLVAGAVILVMCVTGVALTYEKQVLDWADRRVAPLAPSATTRLTPEDWLAAVAAADPSFRATTLTLRARRDAPVTVSGEGGRAVLLDPTTGAVLGEPSPRWRAFFRSMTSWHRWLAVEGPGRPTARAITGAANLGFLFIVVSGMYLWLPKLLTWSQVRQVLWFRGDLPPKARDFNWHNVVGIWSAIPLALVVAGAVPISYGWAGDLVYRVAGEAPPGPPPGGGSRGRANGSVASDARGRTEASTLSAEGLDTALKTALAEVPDWRTATARLSAAAGPLTVAVDSGFGGQPQHRTTFIIERATGAVTRRETFDDFGPGRQWRTWFRFVHTGEYYGLAGQTVAGLVSVGGGVLVYTGIALSLRRFTAWRKRRAPRVPRDVAA